MQRVARSIFTAQGSADGDTALLAGEVAAYAARLPLPAPLPPSFHGTAVRYTYHVVASCRVTDADGNDAASVGSEVRTCTVGGQSNWFFFVC